VGGRGPGGPGQDGPAAPRAHPLPQGDACDGEEGAGPARQEEGGGGGRGTHRQEKGEPPQSFIIGSRVTSAFSDNFFYWYVENNITDL